VVLNLTLGSLVMNGYPELYPKFFNLDLNFFFHPVSGAHFWLYALLVTFTLFGVNLLACIVDSAARLLANRKSRLNEIAALLFHIALLVTMVAHLYEGFYASTQRAQITTEGVELPELGKVQVESLNSIYYPDGSLKDTEVKLLFNKTDGRQIRKMIAYNQPAIFDKGRRQVVLLGSEMMHSGVVVIRDGDNREFRMEENKPQALRDGDLLLHSLFQAENGRSFAQFLWLPANGSQQQHIMALESGTSHSQIKIEGAVYRFNAIITEQPLVFATVRYNPAIPLMIVSLMLVSAATLMLAAWLKTRNTIQAQ
jgi:hypothetical protein